MVSFSVLNLSIEFEVPPSSLNMSSHVPPPAYAGETPCYRQQTLSLTPQTPQAYEHEACFPSLTDINISCGCLLQFNL